VRAVLLEAAGGVPGVMKEPPPVCGVMDFEYGRNPNVRYILLFWIDDMLREGALSGAVRERVWYGAERAGLEGPCARDADEGVAARVKALGKVAILSPLDARSLEELAASAARRRFAAGERILRQGDAGDSLFVVERGRVRVSLSDVEVATVGAGECFGEMSLLAGEPRSATCEAVAETVCWEIPKDGIAPVFARNPALLEEISALLAARQKETADAVAAREGDAPAMEKAKARVLGQLRAYFHLD
jgi:CRP-like cAMP-binding protein